MNGASIMARIRLFLLAVTCWLCLVPAAHAIRPPSPAELQLKEETPCQQPLAYWPDAMLDGELRNGLFVLNNPLRYTDPSGHDPAYSMMFAGLNARETVDAARIAAPITVGMTVAMATGGAATPLLVSAGASTTFAAVGSGLIAGAAGDLASQGTQIGLGQRKSISGQEVAISSLAGGALSGAASKIASLKTTPAAAPEATPAGTAQGAVKMMDPSQLRLPATRSEGADPFKLADQIRKFGTSTKGMSPIEAIQGANGELSINNGVTRATRAAMTPGTKVPVQVTEQNPKLNFQNQPKVGDKLPGGQ